MSMFGKKLKRTEIGYAHYCPACGEVHYIPMLPQLNWDFNNDPEKPTFSPSIRITSSRGEYPGELNTRMIPFMQCHYYIKNGQIEYCSDCPHKYANLIVELPDWDSEPDAVQ